MIVQVVLRSLFTFFWFLTSLWALLAYIPFTYQQVHKGGLVPALNAFGGRHQYWYWLAILLAAGFFGLEPLPKRRRRLAMALRAGFWYIHVPLGIYFAFRPAFAAMQNTTASYVWALLMLEPIAYVSLIAIEERWPEVVWAARDDSETSRLFLAALLSGFSLAVLYSGIGVWRGHANWSFTQGIFGAVSSLMTHCVLFAAFAVLIYLFGVIAGWFARPPLVYFCLCHAFGAAALDMLFQALVFPSMSFSGPAAKAYGAAAGLAITLFLCSVCLLSARTGAGEIAHGFSLALWFPRPSKAPTRGWRRTSLSAGILVAAAVTLAAGAAKNDWNYLFQKLTAMIMWIAAFRFFYLGDWKVPKLFRSSGLLLLGALAALPAYRMVNSTERALWPKSSKRTLPRFLDAYSGFDISYKVLRDALAVSGGVPGFYQFLARNTNLPTSIVVKPAEVKLAPLEVKAGIATPHIFIFVIDSLRRDYLSPYNSRIDFTPNIGKFAQDSTVFRNSHTRYGGTGLAEPSIWVGGAMIHKQYVTPFAPMNSLQKLLEAHHYQAYVTRDSILRTVVTDSPIIHELSDNVDTMNYDLCSTLSEVEEKLDAASRGPMFVYAQPQNIHISVINRTGGKSIDGGSYPGFYAPYASRLRRIDGCFGKFIDTLKQRGLYDSSVVVFTADHGDSLGEEGRWGHAYTIFPEIVRVPLIVHLPVAWRSAYRTNTDMLSFNSDVTPSLYYLLGHRPVVRSELFGRPLFTEQAQEQNHYKQETYLVSSSYAAVYGILSGDGKFLFTADAVNLKDSWFDMTESAPSGRSVPTAMRSANEALIRDKIGAISAFYRFTPLKADP